MEKMLEALNAIQYKVDVKNIEGFADAVSEAINDCEDNIKEWAGDAAENVIRNATFSVNVSV